MIASSKEADSSTRQEGNSNDANNTGKGTTSSSSSSWLRLKDPRIVRVSRAFGGKDRHSKVCTIRGLRDRRVRLSVPTAIQLYDLQDRLGLNQPSKVVDWLLNAAKHEIDELPPLPVSPGNFVLNHQMMLTSPEAAASQSNKEGTFKSSSNIINWEDPTLGRSSLWSSDAFWRAKSKEVERETTDQKESWIRRSTEEEKQESRSTTHSSSIPALLNNAVVPYGSFYHLEPSNHSLTHFGSHGFASHVEDHHHLHGFNAMPLPASTLSLVCPPPAGTTQSFFPNSHSSTSLEIDPRQVNHHVQMLSSTSENPLPNPLNPPALYSLSQSNIRPFTLSMSSPRPLHSHSNNGNQPDKNRSSLLK
ncbi:hypothetical protein SLA2020_106630 [Shorea laevis]